jgi:hypothetical protein
MRYCGNSIGESTGEDCPLPSLRPTEDHYIPPNSYRYKMYEDEGGNYDVHMMETVGGSRKNVLIFNWRWKMYIATVPGRTMWHCGRRQGFHAGHDSDPAKGRKVSWSPWKQGCNRALYRGWSD